MSNGKHLVSNFSNGCLLFSGPSKCEIDQTIIIELKFVAKKSQRFFRPTFLSNKCEERINAKYCNLR